MEMNQDNFARWIFAKGLRIKNYNYDVFYDICRIQEQRKFNQNIHNQPIKRKFVIFFRELGSHLWYESESIEIYDRLLLNNSQAYELEFCFNNSYFHKIPFVNIKKIK
jgi:hypothetical protein